MTTSVIERVAVNLDNLADERRVVTRLLMTATAQGLPHLQAILEQALREIDEAVMLATMRRPLL